MKIQSRAVSVIKRISTVLLFLIPLVFRTETVASNSLDDGGNDLNIIKALQKRSFIGIQSEDRFGQAVSSAGDVNGDGFDDLIVGAPYNDAGGVEFSWENIGRAYIYYGGPGMDYLPDVILSGDIDIYIEADRQFGQSVNGAGDLNGDGFADVIVGSPYYSYDDAAGNHQVGRALIFFGGKRMDNTVDIELKGEWDNGNFGSSVAGIGDINGDGFDDVAVGAFSTNIGTGSAYVYLGGESMSNTPTLTINGASHEDQFGLSVSPAGDINDDGYADWFIGSQMTIGGNIVGRAHLYYGSDQPDGVTDHGFTEFYHGTTAGDVNGDGRDDFVVWRRRMQTITAQDGKISVYLGGSDFSEEPFWTMTGSISNTAGGGKVARAGDFNDDGFDDLLVGKHLFWGGKSMDQIVDAVFTSPTASNQFCDFLAPAGDVNGDGIDDVLTGDPGDDTNGDNAGKAYLFLNAPNGHDIPDNAIAPPTDELRFGRCVSDAGDFNGDGFNDFIVGAPSSAHAMIYFGGAITDNVHDIRFHSSTGTGNSAMGISASSLGDINHDGYDDIIIGATAAHWGGPGVGQAYIFYGGADGDSTADLTFTGEGEGHLFGTVDNAGDVNGDGHTDILIGSSWKPSPLALDPMGRVYLYFGGIPMDNVVDHRFTYFFTGVGAGDVNGDGYSDIMLSQYENEDTGFDSGRVHIFFGGRNMDYTADVIINGDSPGDWLGLSIDGAGDVNGDGYDDVIVGSPGHDNGDIDVGATFIYYGGPDMDNQPDVTILGLNAGDRLGTKVAAAGDINGDGFSDVMVGDPTHSALGPNTGRVYVYFGGAVMDVEPDIIMTGEAEESEFGTALSFAGDLNQDGCDDVIIGAPSTYDFDEGQYHNDGRAYLHISSSPPVKPMITSVGDVPNDQGGFVTVRWKRSGYDGATLSKVMDYVIQRSTSTKPSHYAWENLATLSATQSPDYEFTAPTPFDSFNNTDGTCAFRIIARATNTQESWKSDPMTGFSLDNLAPQPVTELSAELIGSDQVKLTWNGNRIDPDVKHFVVYRGKDDDFTPDPSTHIGTSTDTTFIDMSPNIGETNYYIIETWDIHHNRSDASPTANVMVTFVAGKDSGLPRKFALKQNHPNPFNPNTKIGYAVPKTAHVKITIYDIQGKEVRRLVDKQQSTGYHTVEWDGIDQRGNRVATGIYLYTMQTEKFVKTRKCLFVR